MSTSSAFYRPALVLALAGLLASCEKTNDSQPAAATGSGNNVYVINEGNYGSANASVTFYDKTTRAASPNLFQNSNGRALGDVIQSMTVYNGTGYLVVNNSNKVEVVNLPSFRSAATISTVQQPRYLVTTPNGRGYITEWLSGAAGRVSIIDLSTNAVLGTLPTGRYPEKLLYYNNTVYVPNSDENTLTVIDVAQQKVTSTLTVSDGPSSLVVDKNGYVWVLCNGITRYGAAPSYPVLSSTPGALVRFNPATPTQQVVLPFAASMAPSNLRISPAGDQLYYRVDQAEYRMDVAATTLPTTAFIRRGFYGFNIDPADGTLYGCAASFTGASQVLRYRTDGAVLDSFPAGVGSNGVTFY